VSNQTGLQFTQVQLGLISLIFLSFTWASPALTHENSVEKFAESVIAQSKDPSNPVENATGNSDLTLAVITWAINPGPPFHIVSGSMQGQGFCDALVDSISQLLPNYQHKKVIVPQGRVLDLLSAPNSQMCFPCMIKREQAPTGVKYTESTHQFPRHMLITRQSLLTSTKPISLQTLLASGKYRYGYPQGRRYGVLDPLLETYKTDFPQMVLARAGPGEADSVLSLIEIGRIDFTVDYPMVLKYHRLMREKDKEMALKMLPIEENQQHAPQQAVGCADNPWGRAVVSDINKVIPQVQQSPPYLQAKKFWLEDATN